MSYSKIINLSNNILPELLEKNKSKLVELQDKFNNNVNIFKNIKTLISSNLNNLINELTILDEIQQLIKKDEINESPAAFCSVQPPPCFPDGTYIYVHKSSSSKTFSCPDVLPASFEVKIKLINIHSPNTVIGVSNKVHDESKVYLGGDLGPGNWGIAGNESLGEEGKWSSRQCLGFDIGDEIIIKGENGVISYSVNGNNDNNYSYDLRTTELYLSFSFYFENDTIEIIE